MSDKSYDKSYDSLRVTHNISPVTPTNYGGTVLKESDDLDVLGDIIFLDDLWESTSLGFQSSFSWA